MRLCYEKGWTLRNIVLRVLAVHYQKFVCDIQNARQLPTISSLSPDMIHEHELQTKLLSLIQIYQP